MTNSPTFCVRFADSAKTRMTVWHDTGRKTFDLVRGVKARHAYRSRTNSGPPAISAARFEDAAGAVLKKYDPKQIAEAAHDTR